MKTNKNNNKVLLKIKQFFLSKTKKVISYFKKPTKKVKNFLYIKYKISLKILIITLLLFILLFISLIYIYTYKSNIYNSINEFSTWINDFSQKNSDEVFKIDSITLFSSCDAKYKTSSANQFTIENLYQYLDIAIFISPENEELTAKNTYKSLYITNFTITSPPNLGQNFISYKDITSFSNSVFPDSYILSDSLDSLNFDISSEDNTNLATPTLYNNFANPITLTYITENIVTDYTFTNTDSSITYDGTLLNKCNINIEDIFSTFSFDIYIENNLGEKYKTTIFINNTTNINTLDIDGYTYTSNLNVTSTFYRYE